MVFVKARINGGKPMPFIVDSGATETVITPPTAKQAGVDVRKTPGGQGKGTVRSLAVGAAVLHDFTTFVFDPPQALTLRLNHGVDYRGLIGYTFLSHFVTTFDYPNSRLRFVSPSRAPSSPSTTAHTIPFRLKDRLIHAQGMINGKGPVTFLVDTGSAEVLIHPRWAATFGLTTTPHSPERPQFVRLQSLSLGSATRHHVRAVIHTPPTERQYSASYHAILGYPFLSHFAVTLNYRNRQMTLVPGGHDARDASSSHYGLPVLPGTR